MHFPWHFCGEHFKNCHKHPAFWSIFYSILSHFLVQLSYMTDDTRSQRNEGKTELTFELFWRPLDDDGSPPAFLSPCSIDSRKKLRPWLELGSWPLELERGLFELSSWKRTTFRPRMASWLLLRKPRGPQAGCLTFQSMFYWKIKETFLVVTFNLCDLIFKVMHADKKVFSQVYANFSKDLSVVYVTQVGNF